MAEKYGLHQKLLQPKLNFDFLEEHIDALQEQAPELNLIYNQHYFP